MRIIFAGTPEFAARALGALLNANHDLVLVLTQPDRPAGRGMQAHASAVKQLALSRNLPLRQPQTLRDAPEQQVLAAVDADVMVVAAYGLILPQAVLNLPRRGAINIHASVLPRWRGAAPIQRALLAGDSTTGISIMQMEAGLDTGPILLVEETPIEDSDTSETLHDRLADMGARLIVEALQQIDGNTQIARAQPESGATYAKKLTKADTFIDWSGSAEKIWRQIRALNPSPGAQARLLGTNLKIWQATPDSTQGTRAGEIIHVERDALLVACGENSLRLTQLQKPGGKRMMTGEFLRGFPIHAGATFEI